MLGPTLVCRMLVLVWRCSLFKRSCTVEAPDPRQTGLLRATGSEQQSWTPDRLTLEHCIRPECLLVWVVLPYPSEAEGAW